VLQLRLSPSRLARYRAAAVAAGMPLAAWVIELVDAALAKIE
jgi:hypothetical protein